MTADLSEFLFALAHRSFTAGVLVIVVLLTQRLFRNQLSPRWRCALWLLVVARLLPFSFTSDYSVFNLLPRWSARPAQVPSAGANGTSRLDPTALAFAGTANRATQSPVGLVGSTGSASTLAEGSANAVSAGHFNSFASWPYVLFSIWLGGVLGLGAYVLRLTLSLQHSVRRSLPVTDPAVLTHLNRCCERMGVKRAPVMVESTKVRTPALHGLFRPRLLLPAGFTRTFSAGEQQFVFLHELAHLRRRDLLLNWLVTVLQILHWFNPLIWLAFSRWRVDREIACDAAALEASAPASNRAYGETILRLLENVAATPGRPGLVGILEEKRQLRRRLTMIARFSPARRSPIALVLAALLGLAGLTDAQVPSLTVTPEGVTAAEPPPAVPVVRIPPAPYVVVLVNASETMLGETAEEIAALRLQPDEVQRNAPKWQRTAQTLEAALTSLAPDTSFRVLLFRDLGIQVLGGRDFPDDRSLAIGRMVQGLGAIAPRGGADLEAAFGVVADEFAPRPERVVLITDGLPTMGGNRVAGDESSEAQRLRFFSSAAKRIPPRVPVHTVLLPLSSGDPSTPGMYWGLAHATGGQLTVPPKSGSRPRTHLAFVIDTSGSMRDPTTGGVWPIVLDTLETMIRANPQLTGLQLLDGDGRFVLGRRGSGAAAWLANTPEVREQMQSALRRYDQDTVSNPVPGVYNAVRFLQDKAAPDFRMGICLLGDEFNTSDPTETVLRRLDQLNPPDASGHRPIVIDAVGFPTTVRYQLSMGNTGLKFAHLMRTVVQEHGGSFVALPGL